jgi:hypothetical protein
MIRSLLICVTLGLSATNSFTQQSPTVPNWDAFRFLVGDWVGDGTGIPGKATGGFSFAYDLQGQVLVRKNYANYPPTKDRPAFSHDDLMVVYQEPGGKQIKASYFDSEGHVIQYAVKFSDDGGTLTFLSDPLPSTPRFRFTYIKKEPDVLALQFDIAPPGKPEAFSTYVSAIARRKGPK